MGIRRLGHAGDAAGVVPRRHHGELWVGPRGDLLGDHGDLLVPLAQQQQRALVGGMRRDRVVTARHAATEAHRVGAIPEQLRGGHAERHADIAAVVQPQQGKEGVEVHGAREHRRVVVARHTQQRAGQVRRRREQGAAEDAALRSAKEVHLGLVDLQARDRGLQRRLERAGLGGAHQQVVLHEALQQAVRDDRERVEVRRRDGDLGVVRLAHADHRHTRDDVAELLGDAAQVARADLPLVAEQAVAVDYDADRLAGGLSVGQRAMRHHQLDRGVEAALGDDLSVVIRHPPERAADLRRIDNRRRGEGADDAAADPRVLVHVGLALGLGDLLDLTDGERAAIRHRRDGRRGRLVERIVQRRQAGGVERPREHERAAADTSALELGEHRLKRGAAGLDAGVIRRRVIAQRGEGLRGGHVAAVGALEPAQRDDVARVRLEDDRGPQDGQRVVVHAGAIRLDKVRPLHEAVVGDLKQQRGAVGLLRVEQRVPLVRQLREVQGAQIEEDRRAEAVAVEPREQRRIDVHPARGRRQRRLAKHQALARDGRAVFGQVEVRRPRQRAERRVDRVARRLGEALGDDDPAVAASAVLRPAAIDRRRVFVARAVRRGRVAAISPVLHERAAVLAAAVARVAVVIAAAADRDEAQAAEREDEGPLSDRDGVHARLPFRGCSGHLHASSPHCSALTVQSRSPRASSKA